MFKGAAAGSGSESRPRRALAALAGGVTRAAAKSASLMAAAVAVLAILPLRAVAQAVDFTWRPAAPSGLENGTRDSLILSGDSIRFLTPLPAVPALRFIDSFEESEADRESRGNVLAQCGLLARIPGWTALDVLAGLPNGMMDLATGPFRSAPGRDEILSLSSPGNCSLLSRVFSCPIDDPSGHPFDDLVGQVLSREQKYFARFQDSGVSAFGIEDDPDEVDTAALMRHQNRILFDSCRKLYFGRYVGRFDQRFREEAYDISRWSPIDFVVAPAALAGYAYLFGWERKIDLLGLRWSLQVEPLRRILDDYNESRGDLVSAAGMEIGLGSFPVKVLVSMGIVDGDARIDFIGFGTSLGKATQAVSQALSPGEEK